MKAKPEKPRLAAATTPDERSESIDVDHGLRKGLRRLLW
ncbi:hypothetical protein J2W42_004948 [Rhizobium tibeticum]|nr:hypothetical protein [Rhizobium tibeticum]